MKKTVFSISCGVAVALGIATVGSLGAAAQEAKKQSKLSDRTVRVIMGAAFAGIPDELPSPDGKKVKIDRSDPKKFMIPLDDAREIIIKSVMSARAELCGLTDLKRKHFESIMRRELARKKWTPFQMTYIDVLQATTEIFMTGSQAIGEDAKKEDDPSKDIRNTYKCSSEERQRVKAAVEQDIKELAQTQ